MQEPLRLPTAARVPRDHKAEVYKRHGKCFEGCQVCFIYVIGHLNVIRRAKEQCDYLIVGVSTDKLVRKEKNKTPIIPYEERAEIVSALKYVDKVVPQYDKNKLSAWEKYRFDRMFVGSDCKGTPQWNKYEEQFSPLGVEIVYLPHTDGISSTKLTDVIKSLSSELPD